MSAAARTPAPSPAARSQGSLWGGAGLFTGYSEDYVAPASARDSGAIVLPKPITAAGLAAAVRRSLDQT